MLPYGPIRTFSPALVRPMLVMIPWDETPRLPFIIQSSDDKIRSPCRRTAGAREGPDGIPKEAFLPSGRKGSGSLT
jgi:hypothetical protein